MEKKCKQCKECICKSCEQVAWLEPELNRAKAEITNKTEYIQEQREIINNYQKEIEMYKKCQGKRASKREEELRAELQQYKDMAKKGLDEFKDIGGCWGCGLQLQLNQDIEDIKRLKAENEKLKEENLHLEEKENEARHYLSESYNYHQCLKEIQKYINSQGIDNKWNMRIQRFRKDILDKINEVIGAENER